MPLTKPSIENDALMARYPFLPQGNEFLKSILNKNGITVDDLIEEPWLEEVRARGRVRLRICNAQGRSGCCNNN